MRRAMRGRGMPQRRLSGGVSVSVRRRFRSPLASAIVDLPLPKLVKRVIMASKSP
jgi:hypothetical protein